MREIALLHTWCVNSAQRRVRSGRRKSLEFVRNTSTLRTAFKYVTYQRSLLPFTRRFLAPRRSAACLRRASKPINILSKLCYTVRRTCTVPVTKPRLCALYKHQRTALNQLYSASERVLALHMKMGGGKTRVALEFVAREGSVLYVTLPSLVQQVTTQVREYLTCSEARCVRVCSVLPQPTPALAMVIVDEYPKLVRRRLWTLLASVPSTRVLLLTGETDELNQLARYRSMLGSHRRLDTPVTDALLRQADEMLVPIALSATQKAEYERMAVAASSTPSFARFRRHREQVSQWKINQVVELLSQFRNFPCAVYSEFNSTLKELRSELITRDVPTFQCFTSTPKKRYAQLQKFLSSAQPGVLLCSVDAASRGINLGAVRVLLLLEGFYNAADVRQTRARLVRVDQTPQTQLILQVFFAGTFEEKLVRSHDLLRSS